ncbi:MAG: hypothetical protein ACOYO1_02555 [Bacteroidales bacterium]
MVYLRITENTTQAKAVLAFLKTMPFVEIINEKEPNKITLKAIDDARKGNVIKTSSKEDLFKKLKS